MSFPYEDKPRRVQRGDEEENVKPANLFSDSPQTKDAKLSCIASPSLPLGTSPIRLPKTATLSSRTSDGSASGSADRATSTVTGLRVKPAALEALLALPPTPQSTTSRRSSSSNSSSSSAGRYTDAASYCLTPASIISYSSSRSGYSGSSSGGITMSAIAKMQQQRERERAEDSVNATPMQHEENDESGSVSSFQQTPGADTDTDAEADGSPSSVASPQFSDMPATPATPVTPVTPAAMETPVEVFRAVLKIRASPPTRAPRTLLWAKVLAILALAASLLLSYDTGAPAMLAALPPLPSYPSLEPLLASLVSFNGALRALSRSSVAQMVQAGAGASTAVALAGRRVVQGYEAVRASDEARALLSLGQKAQASVSASTQRLRIVVGEVVWVNLSAAGAAAAVGQAARIVVGEVVWVKLGAARAAVGQAARRETARLSAALGPLPGAAHSLVVSMRSALGRCRRVVISSLAHPLASATSMVLFPSSSSLSSLSSFSSLSSRHLKSFASTARRVRRFVRDFGQSGGEEDVDEEEYWQAAPPAVAAPEPSTALVPVVDETQATLLRLLLALLPTALILFGLAMLWRAAALYASLPAHLSASDKMYCVAEQMSPFSLRRSPAGRDAGEETTQAKPKPAKATSRGRGIRGVAKKLSL